LRNELATTTAARALPAFAIRWHRFGTSRRWGGAVKTVLRFGVAVLVVFLAAAAVSIYGFGQYEPAWGRGGSLQVEAWLALVGALVAAGSFGIGSAVLRRAHSPTAAVVLGVACAGVFVAACWFINDPAAAAGVYTAFALLVGVPVLAALAGLRQGE
jgi:hypothetical protein